MSLKEQPLRGQEMVDQDSALQSVLCCYCCEETCRSPLSRRRYSACKFESRMRCESQPGRQALSR